MHTFTTQFTVGNACRAAVPVSKCLLVYSMLYLIQNVFSIKRALLFWCFLEEALLHSFRQKIWSIYSLHRILNCNILICVKAKTFIADSRFFFFSSFLQYFINLKSTNRLVVIEMQFYLHVRQVLKFFHWRPCMRDSLPQWDHGLPQR